VDIFKVTISEDGYYAEDTYYCDNYPSEATLKSFLLISLDSPDTSYFRSSSLISFNFEKDGGGHPILKCIYFDLDREAQLKVYSDQDAEATFRINTIENITLTSPGLEKHLTHQNPVIRKLVKGEMGE